MASGAKSPHRSRWRAHPRPICTPDERQALYDLQGGQCAICGHEDVEQHLDHSHRSGKTRRLLCRQQNVALGMFHDSPKLLWRALPYRKLGRKVIFLRHEVEAYLHGLPGLQLRHISL